MRGKSILFINQHYYPEYVSAGQHLTDLAEYLEKNGFDVNILCGRGGYTNESKDSPSREVHNGVNIRRLWTTNFGRKSNIGRVIDYMSFFVQVVLFLVFKGRFGVVVTLTTPPLINTVGLLVRLIRGQKYGIWAMDLHPEAEAELGIIKREGIIYRLLKFINDESYRRASFVVSLGKEMTQKIKRKGCSEEIIEEIPVWNRKEDVEPISREENYLIEDIGLKDRFVVMYSGNAGLFHRFDEVLEVIKRFKNNKDIFFLFVGGGLRREEIENYVSGEGISNFEYRDYFPKNQIKYSLSIADLHLMTLRDEISGIAFPSKLFGVIGVGRPVVMVGPKESGPAQVISENDIGYVFEPDGRNDKYDEEVVDRIVEVIECLKTKEDKRLEMGSRARSIFIDKYERDEVCSDWCKLLQNVR